MDLESAAEEVYSLRPEEFVPRRDELAAQARSSGDRPLAASVKKLAKPSVAAWVVNMLVRHEAAQVEQVLQLGAALREAQASLAGEELRELGRQRRQLTSAVTRQARSLASGLGQSVGDPVATQVEDTLHAAMVDEDAAAAVRTGLLVKPLVANGIEPVDVLAAVAFPEALGRSVVRRGSGPQAEGGTTGKPALKVVPDNSRAIEEAEREVTEARRTLEDERRRLAKAEKKLEKREARALQLEAELEELRRRVAELEQRVEENEEDVADAEETRTEREQAVHEATAALERAEQALAKLR